MRTPEILSGSDARILSVFIAAGADPARLAHWMHDNTDTQSPIDTLVHAGETLQAQHISPPHP